MAPPDNLAILLVQLQYPGMTPVESKIARAWLQAHGADFDRIEFNVRLGEGRDPGPAFSASTRRDAVLLSQKRADILAFRDNQVMIVEVKVRAGLSSLGQLQGYATLFSLAHPETSVFFLQVICRDTDPDTRLVLEQAGVGIECFPRVEVPVRAGMLIQ